MRYALTLFLFFIVTQATADSWRTAKVSGIASPTGQFVVRVKPGSEIDVVSSSSGAKNGKSATATFYRLNATGNYDKVKEVSLLNPVAPVFAAVSDSGELVTLDDWYNVGVGDAVAVIYSPGGKVLRSYRLADMYKEVEIKKFRRTVSSIWWRCPAEPMFEPHSGELEFTDALGAIVGISIKTGAITRNATSQKGC